MTDTEITIEVAKLDGYRLWKSRSGVIRLLKPTAQQREYWLSCGDTEVENYVIHEMTNVPDYLHSRDAIIPVIEKCCGEFKDRFGYALFDELRSSGVNVVSNPDTWLAVIIATPKQLCIALLKSTGKWKE